MLSVNSISGRRSPAYAKGLAALVLLGIGLVVHLVACLRGNINLDEYQFIANGWDVSCGLLPYLDFWDNHGPAVNYVYAIPFFFWPAVHEIIILFRLAAYAVAILTAIATGCAALMAFPQYRSSGRIAAAVLLAAPMYLEKSHEVRGDNLVTALWATGLALCLYGLRYRRSVAHFLAGMAWGLTLWFTPKGFFVIAAGLLVIGADALLRGKLPWRWFLSCGAGLAATTLILVGWLDAAELWDPFLRLVIFESVGRSRSLSLSPFLAACWENPFWMGVALLGVARGIIALFSKRPQPRGEMWLWASVALLIIYYFIVIPTRHRQSLLPLHPVVAVLSVGSISRLLRWKFNCVLRARMNQDLVWTYVLLLIACHSIWHAWHSDNVRGQLGKQIAAINRLASRVPPGECVLSGEGPPLFRPFPLPAHVLVNYLRERYSMGEAGFDIPKALREKHVRFVAVDPRIRALPRRDLDFLRQNYLPVAGTSFGKKRVLLAAGKLLEATNRTTTFTIEIPLRYWLTTLTPNSHEALLIDEKPTTCCVYLAAGEHTLEVDAIPTTFVLTSIAPKRLDWKAIEDGAPLALRENP